MMPGNCCVIMVKYWVLIAWRVRRLLIMAFLVAPSSSELLLMLAT